MARLSPLLGLVALLAAITPTPAQQPSSGKTEATQGHLAESVPVATNPALLAVAQRLQEAYEIDLKLGLGNNPKLSRNYEVTPLKPEHVENALSIFAWMDAELKRYPAGCVKKFGVKSFVLANAFTAKALKTTNPNYSPTFIGDKDTASIFVTVPAVITPAIEALGKGYIHSTFFNYLLGDASALAPDMTAAHWKTIESDDTKPETESGKRLTKSSNTRDGLYKIMWDPSDFNELITLSNTDARLKQRINLVQRFLQNLDPQFNQSYWAILATVPESQRIVCLNDLSDTHAADQIKADPSIQSDLQFLETQWGFKVLWQPGSPPPPMPPKVRLEYSYFTDKKQFHLRTLLKMIREELAIYPVEVTRRLNVKNLYVLNDFNFRGAGVAGQGLSWLPQVSFAYGLHSFDPEKTASMDFLRRTIHHEVLHLLDKEFSKEGGPIHGDAWDSLNQKGFMYKIGRVAALAAGAPNSPNAPSQSTYYKDNTKWQGFAEPYGMNVATDDRATLYARLMTMTQADEGRGDQTFITKLLNDPIMRAKAERLREFFQHLKRDLNIASPCPFYERIEAPLPQPKG